MLFFQINNLSLIMNFQYDHYIDLENIILEMWTMI